MTEKALTANSGSYRVNSIDVLRGIIMIIMAIDHTRDFFHSEALKPGHNPLDPADPFLWFTRWITNYCAPTFVFLSGISAWLAAQKRTKNEASLFLIKRGLWLVLVEVVFVTFGIFFNPYYNSILLQVIWVIGWAMVLLGILSRISPKLVLAIGILLFVGHNIIDHINGLPPRFSAQAHWLDILWRGITFIPIDSEHRLLVFYQILPWASSIFVGYGIAHWFHKDFPADKRRKYLLWLGTAMIVVFVVLRAFTNYGNPTPWVKGDGFVTNLLNFLNTSKYPPSLQFLCMTLGPSCIALALFERVKAGWTRIVAVYGQVPFFYYILHFYILHLVVVACFYAEGYGSDAIRPSPEAFFPVWFRPVEFGYSIGVVYLVWFLLIVLLYFPCRWFAKYKKTHKKWWLSYV